MKIHKLLLNDANPIKQFANVEPASLRDATIIQTTILFLSVLVAVMLAFTLSFVDSKIVPVAALALFAGGFISIQINGLFVLPVRNVRPPVEVVSVSGLTANLIKWSLIVLPVVGVCLGQFVKY